MLRPRHRVKSNLLVKMVGLAVLVNLVLWPVLIRLGAFHGVRQELFPVTLVARSPAPIATKPAPVIAKAPPVRALSPARKPPPVLVASVPPAARPPAVSVVEKPPVLSSAETAQRIARRRLARTRRKARKDLIAGTTLLRHTVARPANQLVARRVPVKPSPKPAERVARLLPTPLVNSLPQPAPTVPPGENTVPLSKLPAPRLQPAVALVKIQPAIPESMQNSAWHALFRGQFVVNQDGRVTPQMVASTGNRVLDARALKAAKRWKFHPATRNGVPVASTVKFEIEYAVRAAP